MTVSVPFVGNVTGDIDLKFLPSGVAIANFSIAVSQRTYDKTRQEWVDGEAMFLRVSAFRELAEHVAESVSRGSRVIVVGKLKSRSYEKDGEKRTVFEVEADEVGPSLRFATATVVKAARDGGVQVQVSGGGQGGAGGAASFGDPWPSGGGGASSDSPPF